MNGSRLSNLPALPDGTPLHALVYVVAGGDYRATLEQLRDLIGGGGASVPAAGVVGSDGTQLIKLTLGEGLVLGEDGTLSIDATIFATRAWVTAAIADAIANSGAPGPNPPVGSYLTTETGDRLLTEAGDLLIAEA